MGANTRDHKNGFRLMSARKIPMEYILKVFKLSIFLGLKSLLLGTYSIEADEDRHLFAQGYPLNIKLMFRNPGIRQPGF